MAMNLTRPVGTVVSDNAPVGKGPMRDLLNDLVAAIEGKAEIQDSGKLFFDRASAVSAGQEKLVPAIGRIFTVEGDDLVLRGQGQTGDDPLFATQPRWGVVDRYPARSLLDALASDLATRRIASTANSSFAGTTFPTGTTTVLFRNGGNAAIWARVEGAPPAPVPASFQQDQAGQWWERVWQASDIREALGNAGVFSLRGIAGTANAITATLSDAAIAAGISVGSDTTVEIVPTLANTGTVTLKVGADNARTIKTETGAAAPAGFLRPGVPVQLRRVNADWRALPSVTSDQLTGLRNDMASADALEASARAKTDGDLREAIRAGGVIPLVAIGGTGDAWSADLAPAVIAAGITSLSGDATVEYIPALPNAGSNPTGTIAGTSFGIRNADGAAWPAFGFTVGRSYTLRRRGNQLRVIGDVAQPDLAAARLDRITGDAQMGSVMLEGIAGTGDAITAAMPGTLAAIGIAAANIREVIFTVPAANTSGTPTLNIDGQGAVPIRDHRDGMLPAGALVPGPLYRAVKVAGRWRIVTPEVDRAALQAAVAAEALARDTAIAGAVAAQDQARDALGAALVEELEAQTSTRIPAGSTTGPGLLTSNNVNTWIMPDPVSAERTTYIHSIDVETGSAGPIRVFACTIGADLIPVYREIRTIDHPGGRRKVEVYPPILVPPGAHVGWRMTVPGTRRMDGSQSFYYTATDPLALGQTPLITNNASGALYFSDIEVTYGPLSEARAIAKRLEAQAVLKADQIQTIGFPSLVETAYIAGAMNASDENKILYTEPSFRAARDSVLTGLRLSASTDTVAELTIFDVDVGATNTTFTPVSALRVSIKAGKTFLSGPVLQRLPVRKGQAIGIAGEKLNYSYGGAAVAVGKVNGLQRQGNAYVVPNNLDKELWNVAFDITLTAADLDVRAPQTDPTLGAGLMSIGGVEGKQVGLSRYKVRVRSQDRDLGVREAGFEAAIPLAAAGQGRYSLISYDMFTNAFAVTAGPSRERDPQARQPAPPAGHSPLFMVRASDTMILEVFPVYRLGGDKVSDTLRPLLAEHRRRNQAMCPRFTFKARSRQPLRILSVGDSITQASGSAASATAPNGDRDRIKYLTEVNVLQYQADVTNLIPRYTSAQIGRPEDDYTDHVRIGSVWQLIAGLEERGFVLGADLRYDNFCRSGSVVGDMIDDDGVLTPWGQAAVDLPAYDLVIFAWGMNEISSQSSAPRLIALAERFKAKGSDVLMHDTAAKKGFWNSARLNREQTQIAAWRSNSGYATWQWADGPQWLETLCVAAPDRAGANGTNHPGIEELAAFGRVMRHAMLGD